MASGILAISRKPIGNSLARRRPKPWRGRGDRRAFMPRSQNYQMIGACSGTGVSLRRARAKAMNVRELIELLQDWPDQEATVVLTAGMRLDRWLLAPGLVARRIAVDADNPDFAILGKEPGVEIV